jgi:hypothetical protein
MGDLVFNRFHPFIDRPAGASIAGWIELLEQVVAEHDKETLYVFGHGRPEFGVTGNASDLKVKAEYLSALLDLTRKGIREGKSVDELTKQEVLPGFADHVAPADWITLAANIEVAFTELTAEP